MQQRARETWVDTAKGTAIILVVLFHAVLFLDDVGLAGPWRVLNAALDTFRMPLFFFMAGLFAAKALQWTLPDLWRRRIARMVWLYALWSLVWAVAFLFIPWVRPNQAAPALLDWFLIWTWPNTSTWFVYALALYFAGAWSLRKLPVWVQFTVAGVVAVLFGTEILTSENMAWNKMGMYFVFFIAAVHLGTVVRRLAPMVRNWMAPLALCLYGIGVVVASRFDLITVPGVRLLVSCLALAAGVTLSVALSRFRPFAFLDYLGKRTLQIYLLHFYPVLIAAAVLQPFAPELRSAAIFLPVILTAVALVLALFFGRLGRKVPGLFSLPVRHRANSDAELAVGRHARRA